MAMPTRARAVSLSVRPRLAAASEPVRQDRAADRIWLSAGAPSLIGAVSLFKRRRIRDLVVAAILEARRAYALRAAIW